MWSYNLAFLNEIFRQGKKNEKNNGIRTFAYTNSESKVLADERVLGYVNGVRGAVVINFKSVKLMQQLSFISPFVFLRARKLRINSGHVA